MSDFPNRDIRPAYFKPKNMDTLRPRFRRIIGDLVYVYFGWVMDDGDPYPGQTAYLIYDPNDQLKVDGHSAWIPEEDLDFDILPMSNGEGVHE